MCGGLQVIDLKDILDKIHIMKLSLQSYPAMERVIVWFYFVCLVVFSTLMDVVRFSRFIVQELSPACLTSQLTVYYFLNLFSCMRREI